MLWNLWVFACCYLAVELLHILGQKWWFQTRKLINNTTKWPQITFWTVRLVLPYLRWAVIWCSCLSLHDPNLSNFRNIHITKFYSTIFRQKNVCALYISMNNFGFMKSNKTLSHLSKYMPYLIFLDKRLKIFGLCDFCIKITSVGNFHDDAKLISFFVKKCFLIADNIFVIYRCQYSYFIKCIFFFFCTKRSQFYLLHGIFFTIWMPLHQKHFWKRTRSQFLDLLKIVYWHFSIKI